MTNNPGKRIIECDIADLFTKAYGKATTLNNSMKGVKVTGIVPLILMVSMNLILLPQKHFLVM